VYLETLAPKLNHGWSPLHGLRRHRDKYIEAPTPEYYDLSTDAAEGRNLWAERAGDAGPLADRLAELLESFPVGQDTEAATATLDQEAISKLASLGYVRGRVVPDTGSLVDPKDMVARLDRLLVRVTVLITERRHQEAIPLIKELLATTPGDASMWSLLSVAQAQASMLDEAVASRTRSIELQPNDPRAWLALGSLQYVSGDIEAWRGSLAQAEQLEPGLGEASLLRARHALQARQYEEGVAQCREARKRDPTRCAARSWSLQGRTYDEMGRPAEAEAAYAQAHTIDPLDAAALLGLARCSERQGRFDRVVQLSGSIPRGRSEWSQSRTMLANAYIKLGEGGQAVRVMTEWVEAAPNHPGAHNNLGSVFLRLGRLSEAAVCYQKALEIDPTFSEAHRNLARLRAMEAWAGEQGRDTQ
jgi:tetratricopeptide (TPR) repeat protein